jgi:hypothetical protein
MRCGCRRCHHHQEWRCWLSTSPPNPPTACRRAAQQAQRDSDACQADEQQLKGSLQELRGRVQVLRGDLDSQRAQSGTMRAISDATARGELSGVHGRLGGLPRARMGGAAGFALRARLPLLLDDALRLHPRPLPPPERTCSQPTLPPAGDLGAIDAKYDVAISTACGALDYIVVETTSEAQRVVEFLRRNKLGVATCLILEKQRHLARAMAERVQTPEGGCARACRLAGCWAGLGLGLGWKQAAWSCCGATASLLHGAMLG